MPKYQVEVNGREFEIEVAYRSERYDIKVNGEAKCVESHVLGDSRSLMLIDNETLEVDVRPNGNGIERMVFMYGQEISVLIQDYHLAQLRKTAGMASGPLMETELKAPMPGLVIDVKVQPGQSVNKGETLLVIEAMKMENIIKAKAAATVKTTRVTPGQSVEKGDLLLEFE
jgi:biotin carboxyl carrier protein